jgi:hypothetical protein
MILFSLLIKIFFKLYPQLKLHYLFFCQLLREHSLKNFYLSHISFKFFFELY